MERADAGAEVGNGFDAAGGLHRNRQLEGLAGMVHGSVEVDVTPGEGGAGECGSAQGAPAGSLLVSCLGGGAAERRAKRADSTGREISPNALAHSPAR